MVSADVNYYQSGGIEPPEFLNFIQGSGSSDPTVWRGVMGDVSSDREDPGQVPPQVGSLDEKNIQRGRG